MPAPSPTGPLNGFLQQVSALDPASEKYAVDFVDLLLDAAREAEASDVHLQPTGRGAGFEVLCRLNGVLQPVHEFPRGKDNVISRLKVMAELLTYKTDVPQEGRIRRPDDAVEMRLSTFPTVHGEKGVVRLFVGSGSYRTIEQLGLPGDVRGALEGVLAATSGVLLVAGPAGSGKTTTLYACLRHIQQSAAQRRSIVSLEDPVEAHLPGVAQSQIKASAGFTYGAGLRSILRQDPEVILVGEIRDRETAETVFQASLTGHFVATSFHAGSSAEAVSRLSDMAIEPYILRSGLRAILTQRLARRLCACAAPAAAGDMQGREPRGCPACRHTGYSGRMLLAELVLPGEANLRELILSRSDAAAIEQQLQRAGVVTLRDRALRAVAEGTTSEAERLRIFGAD